MENKKTIFVTGATGRQGGAVARSLVKNGFKVKALVRNPASITAQHLKALSIDIVPGDLNDPSSYEHHLSGVDGIFSVQTYEHGIDKEIDQGITLADLGKKMGVKHFLYTSVSWSDQKTGIPLWDSKMKIENHIKILNMPYTIIRPVSFYENFLVPAVKSRIDKGKFPSPLNIQTRQQLISVQDIGEISAHIFMHPEKYMRQTLTLACEHTDTQGIVNIFSETLGTTLKYQRMPNIIVRLLMGKNLYSMFKWLNNNHATLPNESKTTREEFPNMINLKDWITLNFKS